MKMGRLGRRMAGEKGKPEKTRKGKQNHPLAGKENRGANEIKPLVNS